MKYVHVDVFSSSPLKGNGLTVVFLDRELSTDKLLEITREFRQFETIFILPQSNNMYKARIFTVEEELEFAGHPLIGAGAVIHKCFHPNTNNLDINLIVNNREINVNSRIQNSKINVTMNQGNPQFIMTLLETEYGDIGKALNIPMDYFDKNYPIEVVSTGLPYLIVPIISGLENVKIVKNDFEDFLSKFSAKFTYVFNTKDIECRTWDNTGIIEDIATGSAAGPLCAYLVKHGLKDFDHVINIHQGRYANRPSIIEGWVTKEKQEVFIRGDVTFFAEGAIFI